MSQSEMDTPRTEYVCVDENADQHSKKGQKGASLTHVVAECKEEGKFAVCSSAGYKHAKELTCVICSK